MHKTAKVATLSLLTAAFLSSASYAADVYGKGSTKDAGDVVVADKGVNWTGFYIGGRLGYGHANHDLSVEAYQNGVEEVVCEPEDPECTPVKGVDGKSVELFGLNGIDSSGITGGGQLGFDVQRGRFVFGLFGAYDLSGAETTISAGGTEIKAIEKNDEWSLGARAGILLAPRTLTYVMASYTEAEFGFAGLGENGGTKDVNFSGVTVGGGIEYALTQNVFVGIEGTHTFYDEETLADSCTGVENCPGGLRVKDEIGETRVMGTLKLKLNAGLPGLGN